MLACGFKPMCRYVRTCVCAYAHATDSIAFVRLFGQRSTVKRSICAMFAAHIDCHTNDARTQILLLASRSACSQWLLAEVVRCARAVHRARTHFVDGVVRPDNADIVAIRAHILQFVRRLIVRPGEENKDDELQAMFNYVSTVLEVRTVRALGEHVHVCRMTTCTMCCTH